MTYYTAADDIYPLLSLFSSLALCMNSFQGKKSEKSENIGTGDDNYCNTFSPCYTHYLSGCSSGHSCHSFITGLLDSFSMAPCFSNTL